MLTRIIICFQLVLLWPMLGAAQGLLHKLDSVQQQKWVNTRAIKKASLLPLSVAAFALPTLLLEHHTRLSKYAIQHEFQEKHRAYDTKIDVQLRYAPAILVYGLNFAGVKGKNGFAERSILLAKALLIQHLLVTGMKKGFRMERPEGGGLSFPSSHTARAFATATFMHHEYKHLSPWYSIGAYSVATATAAMRVMNNHHWVPDVLVGAGIGILSSNIAYATHQYRWSRRAGKRAKGRGLVVLPNYGGAGAGVYVSLQF